MQDTAYTPTGQVDRAYKRRKRDSQDQDLSLVSLLALGDVPLIHKLCELGILCPTCSKCGGDVKDRPYCHSNHPRPEGRWYWRCEDRATCNEKTTLLHNSVFDKGSMCRVPLRGLIAILVGFLHNETGSHIAMNAAVHENTVCVWVRHLRSICARFAVANEVPMGGPGIQLEVDETSIGSQTFLKQGKPHLRYFRWLGLIQRGTHLLALVPLPALEQPFSNKPGKTPTMSGGVAYFKKGDNPRPLQPPPLSHAEARPFLTKFLISGTTNDPLLVLCDLATSYDGLINGTLRRKGLSRNQAEGHLVKQGQEEWVRTTQCKANSRVAAYQRHVAETEDASPSPPR